MPPGGRAKHFIRPPLMEPNDGRASGDEFAVSDKLVSARPVLANSKGGQFSSINSNHELAN